MSEVTVVKQDINGKETWRYSGKVLQQTDTCILLEALFNRDDGMFEGIFFKRGDRFVETFYSDRWYNIFEMHDRDDDSLKGYYCNIASPALFDNGIVSYRDLALDLLVYPDGTRRVLDEDEFEALQLDQATREQALRALTELQEQFFKLGKG